MFKKKNTKNEAYQSGLLEKLEGIESKIPSQDYTGTIELDGGEAYVMNGSIASLEDLEYMVVGYGRKTKRSITNTNGGTVYSPKVDSSRRGLVISEDFNFGWDGDIYITDMAEKDGELYFELNDEFIVKSDKNIGESTKNDIKKSTGLLKKLKDKHKGADGILSPYNIESAGYNAFITAKYTVMAYVAAGITLNQLAPESMGIMSGLTLLTFPALLMLAVGGPVAGSLAKYRQPSLLKLDSLMQPAMKM